MCVLSLPSPRPPALWQILEGKFGCKKESKPDPPKASAKRKADIAVAAEGDAKPATVSASVLAEASQQRFSFLNMFSLSFSFSFLVISAVKR